MGLKLANSDCMSPLKDVIGLSGYGHKQGNLYGPHIVSETLAPHEAHVDSVNGLQLRSVLSTLRSHMGKLMGPTWPNPNPNPVEQTQVRPPLKLVMCVFMSIPSH